MSDPRATHSSNLLRWALSANAVFSTLTGLGALLAPAALGAFLGLPAAELTALGTELLLFAAFLFFLVTRKKFERPWIRGTVLAVIALDVLWVIGSAAAILAPATPLTAAGKWTVLATAVIVADFAAFQTIGWRRLFRPLTHPAHA